MKDEQKQQFYFFLILNELQDFQNLNKTPRGFWNVENSKPPQNLLGFPRARNYINI